MQVGVMGMGMLDRVVPVPMGMASAGRIAGGVCVLVVLVVNVAVLVLKCVVRMSVFVSLDQMKEHAETHQ